jgi:hypothetical protein
VFGRIASVTSRGGILIFGPLRGSSARPTLEHNWGNLCTQHSQVSILGKSMAFAHYWCRRMLTTLCTSTLYFNSSHVFVMVTLCQPHPAAYVGQMHVQVQGKTPGQQHNVCSSMWYCDFATTISIPFLRLNISATCHPQHCYATTSELFDCKHIDLVVI